MARAPGLATGRRRAPVNVLRAIRDRRESSAFFARNPSIGADFLNGKGRTHILGPPAVARLRDGGRRFRRFPVPGTGGAGHSGGKRKLGGGQRRPVFEPGALRWSARFLPRYGLPREASDRGIVAGGPAIVGFPAGLAPSRFWAVPPVARSLLLTVRACPKRGGSGWTMSGVGVASGRRRGIGKRGDRPRCGCSQEPRPTTHAGRRIVRFAVRTERMPRGGRVQAPPPYRPEPRGGAERASPPGRESPPRSWESCS